ncbi:MAG: type IV secretion system DNA-binding domain-containing protein [Candidatus Niyogibacteria bacterium]|nr:type IV secretion system DNA-binding domain-containing protein [Candidatus Niyogibacteria bacterium]
MPIREGRAQIIKLAPPPPELPIYKREDPREVVFFGRTNYVAALEEKRFIFGIKRRDRRRHMYVVGKSGVGKSKLLELLIRQDIGQGHGVCVIDPHGDLIEEILKFIPEERIRDTVLIDPADTAWPTSFNPLQNVHPELKHQVAQGLIEVMARQFGANWTPRLEHVLRFTLLALLDFPMATMRGMISMLTDRKYRQKAIDYIEDEMVRRFWAIEFADWSEKFDTEAVIPLVNKLGQFLSNPYLRHIFGQRENKVDLERIMNEKKILLISLSKGKMGEENSSFFGSMFITKLKQAGMARAAMPEEKREDFYLYVDEFHNLVTTTFESLFSESRKYGLALVVAHQYMAQLLAQVRSTVLGNVGTIVVFRVGGDDAMHLEAEMTPVVKAKDMVNLGMQQFYIKMTIDGDTSDPFSAETLRILPPEHESFKDRILEFNHATYALAQEEAKKRIAEEEAELLGLAPAPAGTTAQTSVPAPRDLPDSTAGGGEHPEPLL